MDEANENIAKKKILTQLGIPFFALIGFTVTIFVFATLYFAGVLSKGDDLQNPEYIVESTINTISVYLDGIDPFIRQVTDITEPNANDSTLRSILASHPGLVSLRYIRATGDQPYEIHKSRTPDAVLNELLESPTFVNLVAEKQGEYRFLSKQTSSLYVHWLVPQISKEQELDTVIVVTVDMSGISDVLDSLATLSPMYVGLLYKDTAQEITGFSSFDTGTRQTRPTAENLRGLFNSKKTSYGYVSQNDSNRIEAVWGIIPNTDWVMVAESPKQGLNSANSFIGAAVALLLFFMLLLFYFVYAFREHVLKPVQLIEKGVHYYKTGDYSEPIKRVGENELSEIAELLNTLALNVEKNTSGQVSNLKKALERQNTDTKLLIEKDIELREQKEQLKVLDKAKSMFVSVAAHQMRTPLAAVKWSIKLVMDGDLGPVNVEQKEYLLKGYDSTTRMIDLINDLLDVDKIESDKFSYEFKPEQLEVIVQGIVDDLTPLATEKGVKVLFNKGATTFKALNADKVKLRNALQNLIDNAIKYTIGGGDVTIDLQQDDKEFRLKISDTGIGIPVSEQGKVFGKFFRAKNAVRQETDGSGLGLFIVKKIIEKHGGSVTFDSKENKGTTFSITFPVMQSN